MSSQPGTTGRAGTPGDMGDAHRGRTPGDMGDAHRGRTPGDTGDAHRGQTPGARPRLAGNQSWPLVLPLTLLIILGLAGLRGAVAAPHWNGPLRHDGPVIGLAVEVILAVLLVATMWRRSRAARTAMLSGEPGNDVPTKLRGMLILVLGAGMIAVAVAIFISLHLRVPAAPPPAPSFSAKPRPTLSLRPRPGSQGAASFYIPLSAILYGLLIAALVAAVVLSIWWSQRFRPSFGGKRGDFVAEDPEDLREAVESGRSALRTVDDARAAIIACYVAMENSLAERGAARAVAETPDELLARATKSGLVRGTAAARLTALFYEARFSSHPLGPGQRDAAEQALDELAAALAAAEAARAKAVVAEAGQNDPTEAGAGP